MMILTNRSARRTFFALLGGIIAVCIMLAASIMTYTSLSHSAFNPDIVSRQVVQIIATMEYLPVKEAQQKATEMNSEFISVQINKTPLKGAFTVKTLEVLSLRQYIEKMQDQPKISVQLQKPAWIAFQGSRWLNIEITNPGPQITLLVSFIIALLFIFLVTILICLWGIEYLYSPAIEISEALKRLSHDVNTPPLTPRGSVEMQSAVAALNKMQAHIQKLIYDKNITLAAVSHDLRTPITRLKLRLENIHDKPLHTKMMTDFADMEQMINGVLLYSREEKNSEAKQKLDFVALVEAICNDLSDTGHPVSFTTQLSSQPMDIALTDMKRALNNIINNAIKYGQRASVSLAQNEQTLLLTIDDEGPGITELEREKVFQPFCRVEKSRSRETGGTGLGLAIAKNIIERHGGKIGLQNRNPKGLRVLINLQIGHILV